MDQSGVYLELRMEIYLFFCYYFQSFYYRKFQTGTNGERRVWKLLAPVPTTQPWPPPSEQGQTKAKHLPKALSWFFNASLSPILEHHVGVSLMAQMVKNPLAMQDTQAWSLGQEDPLENGMATYFSIPAWRISWTEVPGGLQSMGSQNQTWLSASAKFALDIVRHLKTAD